MLGTAKTDALRAVLHGICRIRGGIRIGAHLQFAVFVRPLHDASEVSAYGSLHGLNIAFINLSGGAVQRNVIALMEDLAAQFKYLLLLVDGNFAAAGYTSRTHAARHNGCVRSHAAAHGEDTFRRVHSFNILGRSLKTHQHDSLALFVGFLGFIGGEINFTCRRAGRCGKRLSHYLSRL